MKVPNLANMKQAEMILFGVGALAGLYIIWQIGSTAKKAAQAVGGTVAAVGGAANTAAAGTVSGIGSFFGLPTTGQTISDPAEVRWIIDNVGHLKASQWGTAMAFMAAESMAEGSGRKPTGWTGGAGRVADEVVSSRGTATVADPGSWSFEDTRKADPFDIIQPGNYGTGSIYDVTGWGG